RGGCGGGCSRVERKHDQARSLAMKRWSAGAEWSGFIYRHVGREKVRNRLSLLDGESRAARFGLREPNRREALLAACSDRDSISQPAAAPLAGVRRMQAVRVARLTMS